MPPAGMLINEVRLFLSGFLNMYCLRFNHEKYPQRDYAMKTFYQTRATPTGVIAHAVCLCGYARRGTVDAKMVLL